MLSEFEKRAVIDLAKFAGKKIMTIYAQDFDVDYKDDSSPLTQADLASHHCIVDGLSELTPDIPVLSEESSQSEKINRMSWEAYWLIDPLDGTKEFVKKNGEFTVNIALVVNHKPIFGVVYAPALGVTYWGDKSSGAFKLEDDIEKAISVRPRSANSADWVVVGK